jgi:cytochrome c oxidase subunit II
VLTDIEKADANALEVRVVGEQFTWTFYYKDESGKEFGSPQLYVPRGRQVNFTVQSRDIIHDFWVPAFRLKIDAVRGIDTHVRITPKTPGQYPVVCAELCGLGHAVMRQTAHVVEPGEFTKWVQDEAAGRNGGAEGDEAGGNAAAPDGKTIFTDSGCGGCHELPDANTTGGTGPNLDEGLADKDAAFIEKSIVDPSAFVAEGFQDGIMPKTYGKDLDPTDLKALVQYLSTVTRK